MERFSRNRRWFFETYEQLVAGFDVQLGGNGGAQRGFAIGGGSVVNLVKGPEAFVDAVDLDARDAAIVGLASDYRFDGDERRTRFFLCEGFAEERCASEDFGGFAEVEVASSLRLWRTEDPTSSAPVSTAVAMAAPAMAAAFERE